MNVTVDRLKALAAEMREHQELCEELRSRDALNDIMRVRAVAFGEAAAMVEALIQ